MAKGQVENSRFSWIGTGIFITIFAVIGGYLLLNGHASIPPGASLATCTGGTCTEGTIPVRPQGCTPTPAGTLPSNGGVLLGNVSDGVQSICRGYLVYVPNGLIGKASLLVYGHGSVNCPDSGALPGVLTADSLDALANTNRLVVLLLEGPTLNTQCSERPGAVAWYHPNADYPDPGSNVPNDYLYIQAAIHDLEARMTGSVTIDTQRIWYMGESSGGGLATGIMCDDATSVLFAGIGWDGFGYNIASTGGSSPLPINGTERCGGGSAPVPTNKDFVVSWVTGGPGWHGYDGYCATSFQAGNPSPDGHCVPTWAEATQYLQSRFGCGAAPTTLTFGTPNAVNKSQTYSGCIHGSGAGVQAISVPGSADGYATVDDSLNGSTNTNGIHLQDIFDFFVDYGGPASGSGSGGTTPGDINGDGHVDVTDLSILLSHFGQAGTPSQGDIDGNGQVDIVDLSILLSNFGT